MRRDSLGKVPSGFLSVGLGGIPRLTLLICSAILPGLARPLPAEDATPMVVREPSAEIDPVVYDPAMAQQAPADVLEEYSACYLLNREVHQLSSDGRVSVTQHLIARINSRDALEATGDWPLWFDPYSESIVLHVARVHKANGQVVDVPKEDLHFRDENTDFQVFDVYKYLVVSFSQLAVGDVVELKYSRRQSAAQYGGQLFGRTELSDARFPILRGEVVVSVPKSKKLTFAAKNLEIQPTITGDGETTTYRWQAAHVAPIAEDESKNYDEIGAPGLAFSTWESWEQVAKMERELRADRNTPTSELREIVAGLTRDCGSEREKAKALTSWVRSNIRYLSIGHNTAGYVPHSPERVLAKRYGNCIDQSQLLYVMCKEAGVKASHVFLNTQAQRQILPEVPSLEAEHGIVLVEIGEEQLWIDPTATTTAWDGVRGDLFGRQAYVVNDDSVRLLKLPELAAAHQRIDQESTIEVLEDGRGAWNLTRTYHHKAAEDIRSQLLATTPGRQRQILVDDYVAYYPERKLEPLAIRRAHLEDADAPFKVSLNMVVPDFVFFIGDEGSMDIYLPALATHLQSLEADLESTRPMPVPPIEIHDRLTVKFPKGRTAGMLLEPLETVESKWGKLSAEYKPSPDKQSVEIVRTIKIEGPPVALEEREAFAEFVGLAHLHLNVSASVERRRSR